MVDKYTSKKNYFLEVSQSNIQLKEMNRKLFMAHIVYSQVGFL